MKITLSKHKHAFLAFTALVAAPTLAANPAAAQEVVSSVIIDNGTIQLGINSFGTLVTPSQVGLTYIPTLGEALAPGCDCEGWGIADMDNPDSAFARSQSNGNIGTGTTVLTVSGTGTLANSVGASARAVTDITIAGSAWAQVTHDFHASSSPNLYQVDVSILNNGAASIGNLVYRRVMDWDIPPTEFSEYVTLQGWPAANLIHSSDDGFHNPNPFDALTSIMEGTLDQNFENLGPEDHGAAFDFSFGSLATGAKRDFKIFYGAAGNQMEALSALSKVGAEVYSLGMPNDGAASDHLAGTPNTFIFAFAGVGGVPVGGMIPVSVDTIESIRQLGVMSIRRNLEFVGMRTDGLTSGGDRRFASMGDQTARDGGVAIFSSVGYSEGYFPTSPTTESDFHVGHFNFGVDYTFAPPIQSVDNVRVGIGFGVTDVSAVYDFNPSTLMQTKADSRWSPSLTLFAGARLFDRGYMDVLAAYSDMDFDLKRRLSDDYFKGTTSTDAFALAVRGGYDFQIAEATPTNPTALTIGPYGSVEYVEGSMDGFQESSIVRPNNAIIFPGAEYANVISQVGARATVNRPMGSLNMAVTAKIAWEHVFGDDRDPKLVTSVGGLQSLAPYSAGDDDYARVTFRAAAPITSKITLAADLGGTFGGESEEVIAAFQARIKF